MSEQDEKLMSESLESQGAGETLSFAEAMGRDDAAPVRFEPGQQVEGAVVRIGSSWVFIDLGGKSEGCLDRAEFVGRDGELGIKEGDLVKAYFLSVERNEMIFTTKMSGTAARSHLEDAFANGIPLDGVPTKEVKGGYEVKIAGNVRAFCPFSQTGMRRGQSDEDFLEAHAAFRIVEYKENGRNIIVSRRAVIEEAQQQQKEALRNTLEEGMTVTGTVTSIRDFGAFVDIGGLEGLLPVSEIGWGRVEDIRSALHEGQQVEVAIKKLDWDADRFSFSLRDTLPDPWEQVAGQFPSGTIVNGRVARLTDFGAFITLADGIDGLLHISNMGQGKRINHPREILEVGQSLEVKIEGIDLDKRRISLAVEGAKREEHAKKPVRNEDEDDYKQYVSKAPAATSQSMGTFGDLLKTGLKKK